MKNEIVFEEAVKKAKRRNPKYNACIEHPNAWTFSYDDGRMLHYDYYMNDRIGSDKVLSKTSI